MKSNSTELQAATRALLAGLEMLEPATVGEPGRRSDAERAHGEHLVRDNAIRQLEMMELAKPFLSGPNPHVLECGASLLYTISAFQWRYGDHVALHAIEHPGATTEALRSAIATLAVEFATCDLLKDPIPWPDRTFDVVVLSEVIEHIPPTDLPDMIRRVAAPMAANGALVMSSPNPQAISNVLSLAFGNAHMTEVAFPRESGLYGHIRMYSKVEVEELLDYAGLRLRDWQLTNWHHDTPWPGAPLRDRVRLGVQRITPRFVPRWSSGWICTATR